MYEIKAKDVYEDFSQDKEMFGFSNYSFQSKYMKIVVKIKYDVVAGVAMKEFVGLKPKMYLFLVDDKIYILNNGYDGLAVGYQS